MIRRSLVRSVVLSLCVCWCVAAGASGITTTPVEEPYDPLEGSLRFGYVEGTDGVAIDPDVQYAICAESSTLIVNPGAETQTATDLGALVRSDGSWLLPSGAAIVPQRARYAISTASPTPQEDVPQVATALIPVSLSAVVLVIKGAETTKCEVKLKKWKCNDEPCNGCNKMAGYKFSGGPMTRCKRTGVDTDACTMNGEIKVCTATKYENLDCTGEVLATTVASTQQCNK